MKWLLGVLLAVFAVGFFVSTLQIIILTKVFFASVGMYDVYESTVFLR